MPVPYQYKPPPPVNYQSLIVAPRDEGGTDAKTDHTRISSDSGILYKLVEEDDTKKFKVLSDKELAEESEKCQTAASNILTQSARHKDLQRNRPASAKFMPPRFGNTSDPVARPASLKWDKEHGARVMPYKKSTASAEAFATQAIIPETVLPTKSKRYRSGSPNRIDPKLRSSMDELQTNYEKNLGVIEKLYQEKLVMKHRIEALEGKLNTNKEVDNVDTDRDLEEALRLTKESILEEERLGSGLTPSEAANMFQNSSRARPKSASAVRPAASLHRPRRTSAEDVDIDRYVQKQLFLRAKEKEDIIAKKKYELELRERTLRASRGSKHAVDEMLKRQDDAVRKSREKFLTKKDALEKQEKDRVAAIRKERRETLSKPPPCLGGLSWQEMQELAAQKRSERIEKRKVELSMMIAPSAADARPSRRPPSIAGLSAAEVEHEDRRRAEDPSKVVKRLARQQMSWAQQLERAKAQTHIKVSTTSSIVKDMEKRNELYEIKKKERLDRKKTQEDQKEMEQREARRLADEKLLHAKVPETSRRLTKSAENRANIVRKSLQAQELEKKKEAHDEQKRKDKLKVAGVVVNRIVKEFDQQRKSKPGFVELRSDEEFKAKSIEARKEFRTLLRAKRQSIQASAKDKPSLIERHDAAIAAQQAHTVALGRLAAAVGNKTDRRSKSVSSDVFSDEERLKISIMTDGDYDYKDDFN